jgi:hypothetical protein
LLQVSLGPREENRRARAIARKRDDSGAESQGPRRLFEAGSKLDTPYAFANTLCNAHSLSVARVEQKNAECLGKKSHKIRGADELGYLRRQGRFDPLPEAGFTLGDIRLEEAESEEVAVPGSAPCLSNEQMKEGFLPEQARRRIKKRHDQKPPFPLAELCADPRL